jgi:GAF domain-containing protein
MSEKAGPPAGRAGFVAPAGDVADSLQQLARVTAELAAAETIEAVVDAAVTHAAGAIGAAVTTLMVREGDRLDLIGGHGLRPGVDQRWASFPLDDDNPASETARTGRVIAVSSVAELEQRYPRMRGEMPAGRSLLSLPLGTAPAVVGAIGLTFEQEWLPGPIELDFLRTFADACAQAVRRVQAAQVAERRARQLRFLADASLELGSSLDYRVTLARVADLVVPDLADWCAVDIVDAGALLTVAVAHVDPDKVAWAWELQKRFPPDPNAATGAPHVARTGVSEFYPVIPEELLVAGARDEEQLQLLRDLRLRSVLVVPLIAHGRTLGAITMIRTDAGRAYDAEDLAFAEDLGRRAGVAIDNAQLHSETRNAALQLQTAVLPDQLPTLDGWDIAAHYQPGDRAGVGGDFYDAIVLTGGRLAVVVGDVMGHGIAAAAAMAHVRAAVRAYLVLDPDPSAVVTHLQQMFDELEMTRLVSLSYAVLDPQAARLDIVNAGAMPPLAVDAEGSADYLPVPPRRLLGAGRDEATPVQLPMPAGQTLLLFTDGLVERRGELIDVGLERLRAAAGALTGDLATSLPGLVAQLDNGDTHDDVTALAVRVE